MNSPKSEASAGRREVALRALLIVVCLLGTFEALASMMRWRTQRSELLELLEGPEKSADFDVVSQRVGLERTAHHGQLIVARALVYDAMTGGENLSGGLEASVARLTEARRLALEVLQQQPNSWEASMFLGAATYLEWSFRSDRRLYSESKAWEEPLLKAVEEASGKREPRRFLVTAYLETWDALSPAKRAFAFDLVRDTFRDDTDAFVGLASVWIDVAGDRALEVMPDRPRVWKQLEVSYAGANNWPAFSRAHQRYLEVLEQKLKRDLDEAENHLQFGDLAASRDKCLQVLIAAPRDGRFAPLVVRALDIFPPGLHGLMSTDKLREWLDWALELNTVSVVPFGPKTLGRLTDSIGELDAPTGALAALVGKDAYRTARYEKLEDAKWSKPWGRVLIAKTKWLLERGEVAAASKALDDVHRSLHDSVGYWLARQRVARAAADSQGLAVADDKLASLQKLSWDIAEWRKVGNRQILELYPEPLPQATSTLNIEVESAPGPGVVVGIIWDGSEVASQAVVGRDVIAVRLKIDPKPHLLELRALAGSRFDTGRVWIER